MEKEIEEVDEVPDDSSEIIPGIDKIASRDDCERLSSSVICLAFCSAAETASTDNHRIVFNARVFRKCSNYRRVCWICFVF